MVPNLKECLVEFENILKNIEKSLEPFEPESLITRLLFDGLTATIFELNTHTLSRIQSGEKIDIIDDFHSYLQEFFLRRGTNPIRKFMYWDTDYRRAQKADENLFGFVRQILKRYKTVHSPEEIENDKSILGHLARW